MVSFLISSRSQPKAFPFPSVNVIFCVCVLIRVEFGSKHKGGCDRTPLCALDQFLQEGMGKTSGIVHTDTLCWLLPTCQPLWWCWCFLITLQVKLTLGPEVSSRFTRCLKSCWRLPSMKSKSPLFKSREVTSSEELCLISNNRVAPALNERIGIGPVVGPNNASLSACQSRPASPFG